MRRLLVAALLALLALGLGAPRAQALLPGVTPQTFLSGERVSLQANKVTSTKTQVPYSYSDLPFCRAKHAKARRENIGEVLAGDAIRTSPYEIHMQVNKACQILCRRSLDKKEMGLFRDLIDSEYRVNWLLDNLPVSVRNAELDYVTRGYPIGFMVSPMIEGVERHFLYNHVRIVISYNEQPEKFEGARIVGFEVIPFSIKHDYDKKEEFDVDSTTLRTCNEFHPAQHDPAQFQSVEHPDEVIFTYDIKWEASDTTWSERWDVYLKANPDVEIHYFSIVNSLMIVLFLTGVVAMIMLRTLRKDISSYNEMQTLEEAQEESGWKLVHGDVFRPPDTAPMLLAVLAGTGVQVFGMTAATLFFALLGLLAPSNRGGLLTALLLLFVFMGTPAGYFSARLFKLFSGKHWKRNTFLTAMLYPGICFCIFTILNSFLAMENSSGAVPFSTLVLLFFLWFGISTPLVFVGSYFGYKQATIEVPVRTNLIARHIPDQVWYTHPLFAISLGGILPFGAVCIELFFVMSALWLDQIYYVFGFLFMVLIILVATSAEITIVMCYFQLCNEDYRWWWRSYLSAGSSGVYLFIYAIWYFTSRLDMEGFVPTALYFGYMFIASITFSLLTGSIGFFACLWFNRAIFASVKVD